MSKRFVLRLVIALAMSAILSAQTQTITIAAVTDSADFQPGLPQRGSLASIFTTGLESTQPGVYTAPTQYPLSNSLAGVSVWINFLPAPILAIAFLNGYQQINVQVPWEGVRDPLYVEVFQNGIRAHTETDHQITLDPVDTPNSPSLSVFFTDAHGYAIAQHVSDGSLVTPQNPAYPGEYITAYAINLGPVNNRPATGVPTPPSPRAESFGSPAYLCSLVDTVTVGSGQARPSFIGLAPGTIGVYQINFQMPATPGSGDLPLSLSRKILMPSIFGGCSVDGLQGPPIPVNIMSRPITLPVQ